VTGKAKYAAEFRVPNLTYGFIVLGTVAKGTIKSIDTREAEAAAGVIRVFTRLNAPKLGSKAATEKSPPRATREPDKSFGALQSDRIYFNAQPLRSSSPRPTSRRGTRRAWSTSPTTRSRT
jgi:xanthine dehydrogenase YagR molybdenum-binding subunit